jgi:isopenicillin-N epimerase
LDEYPILIKKSRNSLADFLGVDGNNLVFVDNATTGVNTILRSIQGLLKPGKEVLATSTTYPACKNAMKHICKLTGADYMEIDLPFPTSKKEILELVSKSLKKNTALALFDHVVSSTSIIFPVKEIVEICRDNGSKTIIDAAHAPGMLDFSINDIAPDWYLGNCHKWMFAPKSCAFIWTSDNNIDIMHPLVISNDYNTGYHQEFEWCGTRNVSSFLALSDAIEFYKNRGGSAIRAYNHDLVIRAAKMISKELNINFEVPEDMIGSMVTLEMNDTKGQNDKNPMEMRNHFLKEFNIEMPFFEFNNKLWFRISSQIYNEIQDYELLVSAIKKTN